MRFLPAAVREAGRASGTTNADGARAHEVEHEAAPIKIRLPRKLSLAEIVERRLVRRVSDSELFGKPRL